MFIKLLKPYHQDPTLYHHDGYLSIKGIQAEMLLKEK